MGERRVRRQRFQRGHQDSEVLGIDLVLAIHTEAANVDLQVAVITIQGEVIEDTEFAHGLLHGFFVGGVEFVGDTFRFTVLGGHDLDAHFALLLLFLCDRLWCGASLEHGGQGHEKEGLVHGACGW